MSCFRGSSYKVTLKKVISSFVIMCLLSGNLLSSGFFLQYAKAATAIQSMSYFSAGDGPVLTGSGVGMASYGFVMPVFNNGEATWEDVAADMCLSVKTGGTWTDIDNVSKFIYNSNWGIWNDGGFNGYWFNVDETTYLQLSSKTNPDVTLEYTLEFTNLAKLNITSMSATQGPELTAGVTGGSGFTYPVFNGDVSVKYDQVADDMSVYVWSEDTGEWVDLNNNPGSGWIYDQNFGNFYDGGGGLWFNVDKTTRVRLASKSSPNVYLDYTIIYHDPERTNHTLSADITTYTAGDTGAIGIPLPNIDGGIPIKKELDNFVYEIKVNGVWVELADYALSGFSYQANGYNNLSDKNQWGYWEDHIYGLWFQPIQTDMEIRIGYPVNGVKGGSVNNNYVNYTLIGNPNAVRPDVSDLGNIELGTSQNSAIAGWNMIWNDEFNGTSLDMNKWGYDTGYFIDGNPEHWGWGNAELEYYTDSTKNIFVQDGKLNLKSYYEPTTFPEIDPNRVAEYSSGKVTSKDKFRFKYGRIDFSAKLPAGTALWPACWLLPNDDVYGSWASSGEIDVMEARGRLTGASSGAIHYGGVWPANTHSGSDYAFKNGAAIDSDFHVYSLVWEEDSLKWYVDGECFYKATNEQWYSQAVPGNPNAPFDQEFYIIMNLAVGGWFDGGRIPDVNDFPATMQVDYVRVYQEQGSTGGSYTESGSESGGSNGNHDTANVAAHKSVTASGMENEVFSAANITDENEGTRWSSNFADDAWFVIDLEEVYQLSRIAMYWEAAFGKQYDILVSTDGVNYSPAIQERSGVEGRLSYQLNGVSARYVKFQGIERGLPYGYSLWDMQIIGNR